MAVLPCRCQIQTDVSGRELVSHGSLEFPAACYYADAGFEPVPPHWHNEMEIILCHRDRIRVHAGTQERILQEGEGIFVNAGVLHAASQCSGRTAFHSIVFSPSLVAGEEGSIFWKRYVAPIIRSEDLPYLVLSSGVPWQKSFWDHAEAAWEEAEKEADGYEFRMRGGLSECFFLLSKNPDCGKDRQESRRNLTREQRLKSMLTFIHTHYSEPITLGEIADSASVSTTECLRCFRDGLKQSPIRYTKDYRLRIAAVYLRMTDWPVSEIGSRCGFQEMGYFACEFRKRYGMPPGAYRKKGDPAAAEKEEKKAGKPAFP